MDASVLGLRGLRPCRDLRRLRVRLLLRRLRAASSGVAVKLAPLLALVVLLAPTQPIGKRILLLVDVSGSMCHTGRMAEARAAASQIARQPVDEASVLVMAWADACVAYPGGWVDLPDAEKVQQIETWLASWHTLGDTHLTPALLAALKTDPDKELTVVVVTDGQLHNDTAEGLEKALAAGQAARKVRAVVGVWGVGHTKPRAELLALAKAGGGGYVVSE